MPIELFLDMNVRSYLENQKRKEKNNEEQIELIPGEQSRSIDCKNKITC
jgi:hypothetical protein